MLEILNKTYNFAYEYHKNDNSGHDFEHVKRVYANIENLLNEEPSADAFICKMAALLHDVDDHKLNTDGNVARRFLESILSDNYLIEKIIKTIEIIFNIASEDFLSVDVRVKATAFNLSFFSFKCKRFSYSSNFSLTTLTAA